MATSPDNRSIWYRLFMERYAPPLPKCTCRWWRVLHQLDCPELLELRDRLSPVQLEAEEYDLLPLLPGPRFRRTDAVDVMELRDSSGEVTGELPVQPKLARDYVGQDWPTTVFSVDEVESLRRRLKED